MDHPDDPPPQPAWLADLLTEVDDAFVVTGASTPGWPDPWPDRMEVDVPEAAYSRVDDQAKYRILDTRVDAWVEVLERHGLATAIDVEPSDLDWLDAVRGASDLHRVRRLDPVRPDGLGVVLATTLVDRAPFGLDVGVAGPDAAALIDSVPDCGCDACDSGSADLLEVVDHWLLTVARGGVVHVRRDGATLTRTWNGSQGRGSCAGSWLEAPPPGAEVWRGEPWRE